MTEICREFSWVFSRGQMIAHVWGNHPKLGKEPPKRRRENYFQGSQKARNSYCFHQPEQKMLKITEFISWRSWLVFIYHRQLAFKYPPKSTDCLLRLAAAVFNSYRIESKRGCDHCFGEWETNYKVAAAAKLLQSCPTLCDPRDGSPPGSPVPGILQARTLEWVAISFSNVWK